MELDSKQTIRETIRAGWKPLLAKVALLGAAAWGANEYLYPETVEEMSHEQSTPVQGDEISIMTANVHDWERDDSSGRGLAEDRPVIDGLESAIKTFEPTIICAQEVAKGSELKRLHSLGYNVIHASTHRYPFIKETGNAVLSNAPLRLVEVQRLPNIRSEIRRNAIMFEVETNDTKIMMAAMHLSTDDQESNAQAHEVMESSGDAIDGACGDLNQDLETVNEGAFSSLKRSERPRSEQPTFPARNPKTEIDHVMLGCGKRIPQLRKAIDINSDHLAVIETFDVSDC